MSAISTLMPGFDGLVLPDWVERRLREGMAGVCLFSANIESAAQVRDLTASIREANPQAVISIDEEGGDVTRLYQREGSPFPGNAVLGRLDDTDLTHAIGERVGQELTALGINLALAPAVDVNSNPLNPVIGVRSFGDRPDLVSRHGSAWVRGLQGTGTAGCAKHFPGHGDTALDSHLALPTVAADARSLRSRELAPFAAVIDAGVASVMTAHILVPALDAVHPATFSRVVLMDVLRGELGFDGVIVTDALDMVGASGEIGIPAAAVRALQAGCDLLCIGTSNTDHEVGTIVAAIESAVDSGELAPERVAEASKRIGDMTNAAAAAAERAATLPSGGTESLKLETVRRAFYVSERADERLRELGDANAEVHWVRLEAAHNPAVGESPWGRFADADVPGTVIRIGDTVDLDPLAGHHVVVVGKDLHRHPWTRQVIDTLRPVAPLVVDMGWPDLTAGYADIATFGGSRLVCDALLELFP